MRQTKARSAIITNFRTTTRPISAIDLLNKIDVNKTTIYRELDFLIDAGIIDSVDFGDGIKRYELKNEDTHHHHLVCLNCKNISDIAVKEDFEIPNNFKLVKHNLEFFGYCSDCI